MVPPCSSLCPQELSGQVEAQFSGQSAASDLRQLHLELVPGFVSGVVCAQFRPITRSVPELKAVASYLWAAHVEPTLKGRTAAEVGRGVEQL